MSNLSQILPQVPLNLTNVRAASHLVEDFAVLAKEEISAGGSISRIKHLVLTQAVFGCRVESQGLAAWQWLHYTQDPPPCLVQFMLILGLNPL